MTDYHRALALATAMHAGQTRKNGEPYINHCVRVADRFDEIERAKVVAILHDTLEDTDLTFAELQSHFGPVTASLVQTLTHHKDDTYLEYILTVKRNEIATRVKLADLEDNLNGATGTLRDKYMMARWILEN